MKTPRLFISAIVILGFALAEASLASTVYLSDARLVTLRQRVVNRVEPNYTAWLLLKGEADKALAYQAVVPETYHTLSPYKFTAAQQDEIKRQSTFGRDCHAVFRLAVAYRITGDKRYAESAVRLLDAWAAGLKVIDAKNSNTSLSISSGFPNFIIAADLLKAYPGFAAADQERFKAFVRNVVIKSDSAGLCMKRTNNWANFGALLALCEGAYLDDKGIFNKGLGRWKQLVDSQISEDGTLHEEVTRPGHSKVPGEMGLWYSNFSLLPATFGAEVARVNGIQIYDYTSPKGNSLRKAYAKLIPWIKNPATFPYYKGDIKGLVGVHHYPYFEMLTARWPDPDAIAMLKAHRPIRTNHCIPDTTFTHGDLLDDH